MLDDRNDLRLVPSLALRLVQGDAVFAVFGAEGAQDSATTRFFTTSGVPDVFAGTGCACVNQPGGLPTVFGWPPGNMLEGQLLGGYAAGHGAVHGPAAVLYAPDQAGRAGLAGFTREAGKLKVAARVTVAEPAAAVRAIASAKAAKPGMVAIFAPPSVVTAVAAAMRTAGLRVPLLAAGSGLASGLPDGVITDSFLPSSAAPVKSAAASWISLFARIRAKYLTTQALSPAVIDGMSEAYEMTSALFRAGPDLTRAALMSALNGMQPGPSAAPLAYSMTDHGGVQGGYFGVIRRGRIVPTTGIVAAGSDGRVTGDAYPEQAAPADGIPRH